MSLESLIDTMDGWIQEKHKEERLLEVAKRFDELAEHPQVQSNLIQGWYEYNGRTFAKFHQPELRELRIVYDGNGAGSPFWLRSEKDTNYEHRLSDILTLFRLLKEYLK